MHQNCMKNGRPDSAYLYWRWRPHDCDLPKFAPLKFLQFMRNKTWALVGDSISRNHIQSLLCMLSKVYFFSLYLLPEKDVLSQPKFSLILGKFICVDSFNLSRNMTYLRINGFCLNVCISWFMSLRKLMIFFTSLIDLLVYPFYCLFE